MPTARQGNPEETRCSTLVNGKAEMPTATIPDEKQIINSEGLMLVGRIMSRSRRFVGEDHKEVVDYRVLAETETYNVTDWEHSVYFTIGQPVVLKVKCKIRITAGSPILQYVLDDRPRSNF